MWGARLPPCGYASADRAIGALKALFHQFLGQSDGVVAAFFPSMAKVIYEAVGSFDILSHRPLRELAGVQELPDRTPVHPHSSSDISHGDAFLMQFGHLLVPLQPAGPGCLLCQLGPSRWTNGYCKY
jgi:hypothetical protein